jgi:hypothetical protein
MCRIGCRLAATLLFASGALAQSRPPVPIEPLLRSNQPRLIALGAWEVVKRADDSQTNLLIDLAERWDPAQRGGDNDSDWHDAMTVVLDALIQRKVTVSPAAVQAVSHAFPDQALILITRINPYDAEPILRSWYVATRERSRTGVDPSFGSQRLLGRIAAMMLARDHPEEIAPSVLADSFEELAVSVTDRGLPGSEHCLVDCRQLPPCLQETASEPQTGWPPVFQYTLEENDPYPERRTGILIYEAGDTVTWRRVPAEVHQDSCYLPAALTTATRHRLLAEMLHVRDVDIPWGPQMNLTLAWNFDNQFLDDLAKRVSGAEDKLKATVQALYAKGFLARGQFDATRPRLAVFVFDDRQRQSDDPPIAPLPLLQPQDSRTTIRLSHQP